MKKRANAASVIGGADGPTAVFLLKRNPKLTGRQKISKFIYEMKKAYVEKRLKAGSHTLDEVIEYIVNIHGFTLLDKASDQVKEEYNQMRASYLMQYEPELLGEYAAMPELKSESREDILAHLAEVEKRTQKAMEVPVAEFDIDFYKFQKPFDEVNDDIHIIIEKRFDCICGGASGSKKVIRQFQRIFKDIYRYYGVTSEDIRTKSKRYKDVVRALCR